MKNLIIKYTNFVLICFFVLLPLRVRAKVLWLLFSLKQNLRSNLQVKDER